MYHRAPHVIPYQGSKRKLAERIVPFIPGNAKRLIEPFAGSAAVTLSAAANGICREFVIADKLEPLAKLWQMIISEPEKLISEYSQLWFGQLDNPAGFYQEVRQNYNNNPEPPKLLYLIARCVKNSIRFNANGEFNQGPDNRRLGMKPEKLAREVRAASKCLEGRSEVCARDYGEVLNNACEDDFVYLDPPWQGTSGKRDPRYAFLLELEELVEQLRTLNERRVPFVLSFDGTCGERAYGDELPDNLSLRRVALNAGRSTQATLLGRNEVTVESLYLSPYVAIREPSVRASAIRQDDLFAIS